MYRLKEKFILTIMLINLIQFNSSYQQQQQKERQKSDDETLSDIRKDEKPWTQELDCDQDSQFCYKSDHSSSSWLVKDNEENSVFLFFDINPQEGFNLRRDVYMRIAILANYLNKKKWLNKKWIIVLPPWDNLYHWKSKKIAQKQLKWSTFFDIESLNRFTPVIELDSLLKNQKDFVIDTIYYLELDQSDLTTNGFEQFKFLDECLIPKYYKNKEGKFEGAFLFNKNMVKSKQLKCLSFRGTNEMMADKLIEINENNRDLKSVMLDRAEALLHKNFGDATYWMCRRSMKISNILIEKAQEIRLKLLNSSNQYDNIIEINSDWKLNKIERSENRGGPYIGVHLRRGDFAANRPSKSIVTLKNAASQITQTCMKLNLNRVYLATDGSQDDIKKLRKFIKEKNNNIEIIRYEPSEKELNELKDGGWAIVEQLICAHSKFFIGTVDSTYSLRIQEEREILGFQKNTTFNGLCNDNSNSNGLCKTSEWLIVN